MKYRDLRSELKKFGIQEDPKRCKGSERLFFHLNYEGKGYRAITVTCHGEGKELKPGMLKAALRRFGLKQEPPRSSNLIRDPHRPLI